MTREATATSRQKMKVDTGELVVFKFSGVIEEYYETKVRNEGRKVVITEF